MRKYPQQLLEKKKGSTLFWDNHRRKVRVQILLGTLLGQTLVQLVLPGHFEPFSRLILVLHHRVLLSRKDRLHRGARTVDSFILTLVVYHKCVFTIDRLVMLKDFVHYWVVLVQLDSLVNIEHQFRVLVKQLYNPLSLLDLRQRVVQELRVLRDLKREYRLISSQWLPMKFKLTQTLSQV